MISRLYDPNGGAVLIDGVPLARWGISMADFVKLSIVSLNAQWLHAKMAFVEQKTTLFPGTIAQNIAIAKPGATLDDIVEAAKRVCIEANFVS